MLSEVLDLTPHNKWVCVKKAWCLQVSDGGTASNMARSWGYIK